MLDFFELTPVTGEVSHGNEEVKESEKGKEQWHPKFQGEVDQLWATIRSPK